MVNGTNEGADGGGKRPLFFKRDQSLPFLQALDENGLSTELQRRASDGATGVQPTSLQENRTMLFTVSDAHSPPHTCATISNYSSFTFVYPSACGTFMVIALWSINQMFFLMFLLLFSLCLPHFEFHVPHPHVECEMVCQCCSLKDIEILLKQVCAKTITASFQTNLFTYSSPKITHKS